MAFSFTIPGVSKRDFTEEDFLSDSIQEVLSCHLDLAQFEATLPGDTFQVFCPNGFVGTALEAYSSHLGLVLNPDDVWVLILQGISNHINQNVEALRELFVDSESRQTITVVRNSFRKGDPSNDWAGVIDELSAKLATRAKLVGQLVCDFTTTTELSRTIGNLTLLNALKGYFSYRLRTLCGVPEYVIEGEVEDWVRIQSRSKSLLAKLGLQEWWSRLEPVLSELVAASGGSADLEFWSEFVKKVNQSGNDVVSGHILGMIPYYGSDVVCPLKTNSLSSSQLPSGLTQTPFEWEYLGTKIPMGFVGGFVGFSFCGSNIRPQMAWGIREV